jgi:uroporphyrinogen decarboxylase
MTPKERFNIAARRGVPDRVPVVYYAFGAGSAVLESLGLRWQEIFWSAEKIFRVMLKAHELIPHDNVCSFLSPACGLDALGAEVNFSKSEGPHVDYGSPLLNSWEDLERLEVPDPEREGSMASRIKATALLSSRVGGELALLGGFGGISTWAMLLRGARNFVLDVKSNPEFQRRYMSFLTDCAAEFCRAQVEAGCDWIISAEDAFANDLLDPGRAWEVNGIWAKKLADEVHRAGAGYILHCCGDARLSLEKMVETGADVLSLDRVELGEAKEKVGSKVALMGNIKLKTLMFGKPSEVELECREAMARASKGGGFLLSGGYIYPAKTPVENVLSLIKSAEKYGKY